MLDDLVEEARACFATYASWQLHGQLEEEAAAIFLYQIFPSRRHVRLRSSSPRAPPVMPLLVSADNATISPILLKGCVSMGDSRLTVDSFRIK